MKFKFDIDMGYWAIPLGFGIVTWNSREKTLWVGILCANVDVTFNNAKV